MDRYLILADRDDGETIVCLTWMGTPEAGETRAIRDAIAFGRDDLHDFRAIKIAADTEVCR